MTLSMLSLASMHSTCISTVNCEVMRFGLVSFSPIVGHIEFGLIVCRIWYPHSRMRSIRNCVINLSIGRTLDYIRKLNRRSSEIDLEEIVRD